MTECASSIRVKLQKVDGPSFGLVLAKRCETPPCLYVSSLIKDGEAECSGLIRPGDIILKINEQDISSVPFETAQRVWREAEKSNCVYFIIRCAFGYTTHLETTFDCSGTARTYRITQKQYNLSPDSASKSSLVPIHLNLDATSNVDPPVTSIRRQSVSPRSNSSSTCDRNRRPVKLRNILSGHPSADTLHQSTLQTIGCTDRHCSSSLMNWKHQSSRSPRSLDDLVTAAQHFIDQYYSSIKRLNSPTHELRWKEILNEILSTGSYELKETELIFGAKLAWRNASRCIGRIQWSKLQVFDFRFVSNAREMFEAICNHIKYATNKGNLRSAITIFPQRRGDGANDFRIWNSQLISYAGFVDPVQPGKIIGDPMNVEITQLCLKLGWKPQGGPNPWEILPLVLSANGCDPQLFLIPPELILRVKLTHPKYDWWQEMQLEWYALPAVSGMMLDVGGLEFPAAPFSGWYMVTEIAARDLSDPHRYNKLPEIAGRLGLDTRSNTTLWKDLALAEITVSVLDSYQKAGVTIVDHHTAAESFMKHLENEQRLRGGCPADWVWIVPPMSASLTPVFHQEMLNYELKPSYEYQESPLKTHVWKNLPGIEDIPSGRKIRFKEIAKAVKFTSNLFGKALSKRIKATILYATETGKSEQLARRLGHIFSHAFNVTVLCMDAYDTFNLEHEALLLIVTSTFGNGDPPENARTFARQLQAIKVTGDTTPDIETIKNVSMSYIRISSVDSLESNSTGATIKGSVAQIGPLSNIRFAVFALGSSAYPNFCAFGRYLDNMLADLGGERIIKLTCGDELCGQEQAFTDWSQKVFQEAGEVFCFGDEVNLNEVLQTANLNRVTWSQEDIRLVPTYSYTNGNSGDSDSPSRMNIMKALIGNTNRKLFKLSLVSSDLLYDDTADTRKTIKVTLNLPDCVNDFIYLPGDHLGIYPENDDYQVNCIINRIQATQPAIDVDTPYCVQIRHIRHIGLKEIEDWISHERFVSISPREALKRCIDIMSPPTQQILALLADVTFDPKEKDEIISLASDGKKYENWKAYHLPSFLDLLETFKSLNPTWEFMLTQMPPLQPRYYSISSSPLYNEHVKSLKAKSGACVPGATDVSHLNGSLSSNGNSKNGDPLDDDLLTGDSVNYSDYSSAATAAAAAGATAITASSYSPIELTVAVVTFRTPSGSNRAGVCSQFLYKVGTNKPSNHCVYSFIRSAPNFRMPDKDDLPIIMVGPGTGIAPFRSFWLQRFANSTIHCTKKFGPMSLFFGCRTPAVQLYRDEVELMKEKGVLTHLAVAYSRHPSQPKCYVQDFLVRNSKIVLNHLIERKGHFYVCGDVSMAEDVCRTLKMLLQESGLEDPEQTLINLRESMRFHEDIFGITLRTAEVTRRGRNEALSKRTPSSSSSHC